MRMAAYRARRSRRSTAPTRPRPAASRPLSTARASPRAARSIVQSGLNNPSSAVAARTVHQRHNQTIDTTASGVTVTGDALHFASPHGLETGDAVVYHDGRRHAIDGLTDGQVYYVIKVDDYTIQLASSYANALAGTAIGLGSTGNAAQTITPLDLQEQVSFDASSSTVSGNTIVFSSDDGLTQGQEVAYNDNGGTPIGGLVSGQTYYVIVVNETTISLASSPGGTAIPLTSPGSGSGQSLTPTDPSAASRSRRRMSGSRTRWAIRSSCRPARASRPAAPSSITTAAARRSAAWSAGTSTT